MSFYPLWDFRTALWKKEEEVVDVYMEKAIMSYWCWHLIVISISGPLTWPSPPLWWFQDRILFTEINLIQQSTKVGKMYASVYGASIFSSWNTQASMFIRSVSAAIQKQTSHCSLHPILAHFQSEWVLLAYHQHTPLNQIIKNMEWQNPGWLQQKKLLLKKCY